MLELRGQNLQKIPERFLIDRRDRQYPIRHRLRHDLRGVGESRPDTCGKDTFLDCAYHETLHAFGLMNHADDIPWTTLNQNRKVGYLSIYDRAMLQLLYDPRLRAGMRRSEVELLLPAIIRGLQ